MQKNSLKLSQSQQLKQKLSIQNIQLFKLMELDVLQFEQRVKEELDLNPALVDESNVDFSEYSTIEKTGEKGIQDDYYAKDDFIETTSDYSYENNYQNNSYNPDDEEYDIIIPVRDNESIVDGLVNQLRYFDLTEEELTIGEFIIGNLDDDGYLRRPIASIVDDLSFRQNFYTDEQKVQGVLKYIQSLDPPGIAAMNLQECLLLQLERKMRNGKDPEVVNAYNIIKDYFENFSKKNYKRIIKKLKLTVDEFKEAKEVIINLNPKPTEKNLNEDQFGKYIIPDFLIVRDGDDLRLELHSNNTPNLFVSPYFLSMIKQVKELRDKKKETKDSKEYLNNNIRKAQTFITLIKERQETMIIVMSAIMEIQKDFFMSGDEYDLKPLNLKTIAEITGFDVSTISRITSSKYVQTEFGIFPLKSFFGEAYVNEKGESVSTKVIMKLLKELIDGEDKLNPYSDDELTELLKERGYNIARRTTAKYRENLNISTKYLRKKSKIE